MSCARQTIVPDRTHGGTAARQHRRGLLLSSALATVLAFLLPAETAQAACITGGPAANPTSLDCSGSSTAAAVATDATISVTTADDTSIAATAPLAVVVGSGLGGGDIVLNNIGGVFTATTDGIVLVSSGAIAQAAGTSIGAAVTASSYALAMVPTTDAAIVIASGADLRGGASGVLASAGGSVDIAARGGVFQGTSGDGLTLIAGGGITVRDFGGAATGGQNGLFAQAQAGTIAIDGFTGSAQGAGASAVFAQVVTGGDISIRNFTGSATAGQNAIFAQTPTGTIDLSGFGGMAQSAGANAIFAQTTTSGAIFAQNFSGSATGAQNGIIALTTDGAIDISGFSGTARGTAASGVMLSTGNGSITADNFGPAAGSGPHITGGINGLMALSQGGDISIRNFASSASGGQDGLFAQTGTGSITLSGFAGTAEGTADSGIFARTTGGAIVADAFTAASAAGSGITGGVNGMMLLTDTGNISIKGFAARASGGQYGIFAQAATSGDISIGGFSGSAAGADAAGVFVRTLGGSVTADAFSGQATGGQFGLFLNATGGDLSIAGFTGTAQASGAAGFGLYGEATGTITLATANGAVLAGTADGVFLRQMGGDVSVTLAGTTQVTGASVGLRIASDVASTGNLAVQTEAGATVTGVVGGIRIDKAGTSGGVSVTSGGTVTSSGGTAIAVASTVDGATETRIAASGAVTGALGGIAADTTSTTGSATSRITTEATVRGGSGTAVRGYATGAGDAISRFELRGAIADSANGADASAIAGGAATAEVRVENAVTVTGFGVRAAAEGAGGAVTVTTASDGTLTAGGQGIDASAKGNAMSVAVTTNGTVTAGGGGILASLTGDGGSVDVTTNARVTSGGSGIEASLAGSGGTVSVTNRAAIEAQGSGIAAANSGGATTVLVEERIAAGGAAGIAATAGGLGAATVEVMADVQVTGTGTGILAQNSGTGAVVVNLYAGQTIGSGGTGIRTLQAGDGLTAITLAAGTQVSADAGQSGAGNAIRAETAGSVSVGIGAGSVVSGAGTSEDEAVIRVAAAGGAVISVGAGSLVSAWSFTANGDLAAAAGGVVIRSDGGGALVTNQGTIVGRVSLSAGDDTFDNQSANSWITVGANSFGAGTDAVRNTGRIVTALAGAQAETTTFDSLEAFVNGSLVATDAGLLTMSDEVPGQIAFNGARDVTYVSGVFVGQGNSRLGVDASLGGPGSTSDVLRIGGLDAGGNLLPAGTVATQGQTAIVVNDVSRGPGAYNPKGMLVVEVVNPGAVSYGKSDAGQQASFVISAQSANYDPRYGGVIDKGLFFYDLVVRGNDTYIVGLPDHEALELPKLVSGAQSIWHETTGGWLDRQADLRTTLDGGAPAGRTGAGPGVTPGVWAKAVGSWGSRDATSTFAVPGAAYSYDTGYAQDTYGFIAGADFGKEGVASTRDVVMLGLLGGYVTSSLDFASSPTSATYSGGTVGAYATYMNRNWFVDGLFKADILSMDYAAPSLTGAGGIGQSARATSLGFTLDAGYRLRLAGAGFLEPIATLSYVSTRIGSLPVVAGTLADFGSNDSLRAGMGARIGGPVYEGAALRIEGNLNARLWYEFLADNTVSILNPGLPLAVADDFSGAFGEIGGGFNVFAKTSGWNAFTTAGVKFSDGYVAGNARGGVRYQW